MELSVIEKVKSLISLSNHAYEETTRYRNHVWKMLIWTIGLIIGVITAAKSRPDLLMTCGGKCMSTIFILLVAFCGIWNIHFDYKQFVWNRNLLRRCERILRFFDKGVYVDDSTILPEDWKTKDYRFFECYQHYFQWITAIIIISGYAIWTFWS
jgi:hypothetical protein